MDDTLTDDSIAALLSQYDALHGAAQAAAKSEPAALAAAESEPVALAAAESEPVAPATCQRLSEYETLIAQLQREFGVTMRPPLDAATVWPDALLRRWYAEGGKLTVDAAIEQRILDGGSESYLQWIGAGLPVRTALEPTVRVAGGLLGATIRGERSVFDDICSQLEHRGFVLTTLGCPRSVWPVACAEGAQLWPRMEAGRVHGSRGALTPGLDPSGNARGDRFIESSRACAAGHFPALKALDDALALVGIGLNRSLGGVIDARSDPYLACFPGGGARYGAHFDGGGHNPHCRLTTVLYTNPDWDVSLDGGELMLLDEVSGCWHAVSPEADRVVIFRADAVLHRVEPTHARRHALSAWWYVTLGGEASCAADGQMTLIRARYAEGDPRRHERCCFKDMEGAAQAVHRAMSDQDLDS